MLKRVVSNPGPFVMRIACATLARSSDAAVREGVCEPSDLLLTLMSNITDPKSFETLAEASTNPDVSTAIAGYVRFMSDGGPTEGSTSAADAVLRIAERMVEFSHGLGAGGTYRGEAVRRVVLKLGRCLEAVAQARGQSELVDAAGTGNHVLYEVESAAMALRRLITSANRRVLGLDDNDIAVVAEVPPLPALIERSVSSGVPPNSAQLAMAITELSADLPPPIAHTIARVLSILDVMPIAAPSDVFAIPLGKRRENLPDWLLPRRTIGAFYVVRALGAGGASSVFVARRIEERNSSDAEGFAL
jgi:hypothetical protein